MRKNVINLYELLVYMKNFQTLLLRVIALIAITVSSCENQEGPTVEVQFLDANFFGTCFSGVYDKGYKEVIILDNKTYQDFGDSIKVHFVNNDCSTAVLPNIDFSKYFLIGKLTEGGGCSVKYDRQVIDNIEKRTLVYKIKADYSGNCKMLIINMNWVLIPKVYSDYTIEFQVY
jgi:hypothetical protein